MCTTLCLRCCENVDLACLTSVSDAEQLYTDAALVLDASTRVAAVSGSGANDLHFMHEHTVDFSPFSAHLMLYENGDLARLTSVCDAEQLYTDAALVLDASTCVAAVSGSGAIDLHFIHRRLAAALSTTASPTATLSTTASASAILAATFAASASATAAVAAASCAQTIIQRTQRNITS